MVIMAIGVTPENSLAKAAVRGPHQPTHHSQFGLQPHIVTEHHQPPRTSGALVPLLF